MLARVVTVPVQGGKTDEASGIVRESILPAMKDQAGFKGQLFLTQRDTGKALSINFWETEADLAAFEASPAYRELLGKLGSVLSGRPAGEVYEVGAQT